MQFSNIGTGQPKTSRTTILTVGMQCLSFWSGYNTTPSARVTPDMIGSCTAQGVCLHTLNPKISDYVSMLRHLGNLGADSRRRESRQVLEMEPAGGMKPMRYLKMWFTTSPPRSVNPYWPSFTMASVPLHHSGCSICLARNYCCIL